MNIKLAKKIFITGTDTNVGKTFVSALLTLAFDAFYWKPIQAGLEPLKDSTWLQEYCHISTEKIIPERHVLTNPLSPHLAAYLDGKKLFLNDFVLPNIEPNENLIVEGAGGLLVPINDNYFVIDLIQHLKLPVILVARSRLGTINHSLLSIEALKNRNIPILGVIMNGGINEENKIAIENYGQVSVIAQVPHIQEINSNSLKNLSKELFLTDKIELE